MSGMRKSIETQHQVGMANEVVLPAFIIVAEDDIARRAYRIYVDRGCVDGFDREDWVRAERELKHPRG